MSSRDEAKKASTLDLLDAERFCVYFVCVAVCGYMRFMTFFALNELTTGKLKLKKKMKESGKNNIFLCKFD